MADLPIKAAFEELGIEWKVKEHAVAPTVEDGLTAIGDWVSECRCNHKPINTKRQLYERQKPQVTTIASDFLRLPVV